MLQEDLKKFMSYNPDTGMVYRREDGKLLTHESPSGRYYKVQIKGKKYYLHRLVYFYMTGEYPEEVDHEDGNKLNLKWDNLRAATHSENQSNIPTQKNNTSGVKGLYRDRVGKWRGKVQKHGKVYYTTCSDDREFIIQEISKLRDSLHQQFANHL